MISPVSFLGQWRSNVGLLIPIDIDDIEVRLLQDAAKWLDAG